MVKETLLGLMSFLKAMMNGMEESPTREKVKGPGIEADSISLDVDSILKPLE